MTQDQLARIAAESATIPVSGCRSVAFAPDGSALAVLGNGELTFLEEVDRVIWSVPCDLSSDPRAQVVWSSSAEWLYVLGDGRIAGYESESGDLISLPPEITEVGPPSAISVSASEQLLAVGTAAGPVLVHAERTRTTLTLRGLGPVTAVAWRPGSPELCVARGGTVEFWDVLDHAMLTSVRVPELPVSQLAWPPDGTALAVVSPTMVSKIRVGAPSDRVVVARWRDAASAGPPGSSAVVPITVRFSRDGSQLLIGRSDGAVTVTDRDLRTVGRIAAGLTSPGALDISRDGLLAIRADDDTVGLWELSDTAVARRQVVSVGRRWAARQGRTVGRRIPLSTGQAPVPARPRVLSLNGLTATAFAWWPDGRTACVATAPGRLVRIQPPRFSPLWEWVSPNGPITHVAVGHHGLVAAVHEDLVTVIDAEGHPVTQFPGGGQPAWSPPGADEALAVAEPGAQPRQVLLHHPRERTREPRRLPMADGVAGIAWSADGQLLAAAGRGHVVLWDARTWHREIDPLRTGDARQLTGPVAWSPDGGRLAAVSRQGRSATVRIWSTRNWQGIDEMRVPLRPGGPPLTWSPDGGLFAVALKAASGDNDDLEVWDSVTWQRLTTLSLPRASRISDMSWSPDGDYLAVTYADGTIVLWDIGDVTPASTRDRGELKFDREIMLRLAAAASAVGASVPLSLLSELFALLGGDAPDHMRAFATHRGVATLRALRWPADARLGVAVMLAADLPRQPAYLPPRGATQEELNAALGRVLSGQPCPPSRVAPPAVELARLLDRVDDRLVTFLELLGPEAVAAEPTLPARLRHLRDELAPLTVSQLRLLNIRVPLAGEGRSEGGTGGHGRTGVTRHGTVDALLLSQFALPPLAFAMRRSRDELLYRTRGGSPPPAPHAMVLVLDDTPAAHGDLGVTLRLVAHLLATILLRRGRRCALVTFGEPAGERILAQPEDLIRIWTAGTARPPDPDGALRLAQDLSSRFSGATGDRARVVLLTHPFQPPLSLPGAVTVRVQYPGQPDTAAEPSAIMLAANPPAADLARAVARAVS